MRLDGLQGLSVVKDQVTVGHNNELVSIAGLASLRKAGYVSIYTNRQLRSLHGLEKLEEITGAEADGASLYVATMEELQSIGALHSLSGALPGSLEVFSLPKLGSLQLAGLSAAQSLKLQLLGDAVDFCLSEQERQALRALSTEGFVLDARWDNGCVPCTGGCAVCDRRVGRCRCPLGRSGDCTQRAPRVALRGAQRCVRPRHSEGSSNICTVCGDLEADEYDADLPAPTAFHLTELNSTGLLADARQVVVWESVRRGQICVNLTITASSSYQGSEFISFGLSYDHAMPDCIINDTLKEVTVHPEPVFPWCLDSGDCLGTAGALLLEVAEPAKGRAAFAQEEASFTENSLGALVLERLEGDYTTLTALVEVKNGTAQAGIHYVLSSVVVSWPHGDASPKAIPLRFPDNNVYEDELELVLQMRDADTGEPFPSLCVLRLSDDGDGGVLGFGAAERWAAERRGAEGACLAEVRRHGRSGEATATLELTTCTREMATPGRDFAFTPGPALVWQDGQDGAQCALQFSAFHSGPARLDIYEDADTEPNEAICFRLAAGGSAVVTSQSSANFSSSFTLVLQDLGISGGPQLAPCLRGRPCRLALGLEAPTVALAAQCEASACAGAAMNLSDGVAYWDLLLHPPGRYLVCHCTDLRAVASVEIQGPQEAHQITCFLGQACQIPKLSGTGLLANDRLSLQHSCGDALEPLQAALVAIDQGSAYAFGGRLAGDPGVFNLCWCRPSSNITCDSAVDFSAPAGFFKSEGPYRELFVCEVNASCRVQLRGVGLRPGDRLAAMETCDGGALKMFIRSGEESSSAISADGSSYDFGLVREGQLPYELDLCWCRGGCEAVVPAGRLRLRCARNFFWPAGTSGAAQGRGSCAPCAEHQKTLAAASLGSAACICKEEKDGWAFQETNEACGCRDGFFWSARNRSCQPCSGGQSCLWQGAFARSLAPPALLPGFWAEEPAPEFAGHSVYRCFNRRTCPFSNGTCAIGREGRGCGLCQQGFFGRHDGPCESCGPSSLEERRWSFVALALPGSLGLSVVAQLIFGRQGSQKGKGLLALRSLRSSLSQSFQYLQLLSIVSFFEVRWPSLLEQLWNALRSLFVPLRLSTGCLLEEPSARSELMARLLLPFGVVVVALQLPWLSRLLQKLLARDIQLAVREVLKMLVWLGCLFFSTLIHNGFLLFSCAKGPNDVSTVVIFPHLRCPPGPDKEWLELLPFAVAYNAFFGVGLTLAVMFAAKKSVFHLVQSNFQERGPWSFLAIDFRDTFMWWPSLKLAKDLAINIIAAICINFGSFQLLGTAFISGFYAYACLTRHPFQDCLNNGLEIWCSLSVMILCLFTAGMGLASDIREAAVEMMLEEDVASFRWQGILAFQVFSLTGACSFMLLQVLLAVPGMDRRIPRFIRPYLPDELEEMRLTLASMDPQLILNFDASDLNFLEQLLSASRATVGRSQQLKLARWRSVTPGRQLMSVYHKGGINELRKA
ncbi:unnamed protein product [Effrenium voratum]|uniref:Uncharacterized protein n=1 Tax=Effrenium voratum TaxID=2562239 RepID=A0AA36HVB6_9DINO|nr:unnamed protein product [Effrenium voratum]